MCSRKIPEIRVYTEERIGERKVLITRRTTNRVYEKERGPTTSTTEIFENRSFDEIVTLERLNLFYFPLETRPGTLFTVCLVLS